jgi:hypothetical protein
MPPILKEPKVLTDFNNDAVCILPIGFELTDERWDAIWALHEQLNRFIGHEELQALFPDEPSLRQKKIKGRQGQATP